jgi:hypothetical protein
MSKPWREDAVKGWDLLSWKGEAQWFARKDDKVLGGRLRSLDALIGTIRNAEALGWNLYLNANPTQHVRGKKKLSREDVTRWRYIVVDLDPTAEALAPPQPGVEHLPSQHLLHAHRIFSGRGYQYWLPIIGASEIGHLASSCTSFADPLNPHAVETVMRGYLKALDVCSSVWAPGWKVDPTCSDLGRVVRCPGSVNQRTGRRSTVENVSTQLVDIEELAPYAAQAPQPQAVARLEKTSNLYDVLPHLNVRARTFILEGAESPGRHSACYATCQNLQELGVPAYKALNWCGIGAMKCWEVDLVNPLSEHDVMKIVRQVYMNWRTHDNCTTTAA